MIFGPVGAALYRSLKPCTALTIVSAPLPGCSVRWPICAPCGEVGVGAVSGAVKPAASWSLMSFFFGPKPTLPTGDAARGFSSRAMSAAPTGGAVTLLVNTKVIRPSDLRRTPHSRQTTSRRAFAPVFALVGLIERAVAGRRISAVWRVCRVASQCEYITGSPEGRAAKTHGLGSDPLSGPRPPCGRADVDQGRNSGARALGTLATSSVLLGLSRCYLRLANDLAEAKQRVGRNVGCGHITLFGWMWLN